MDITLTPIPQGGLSWTGTEENAMDVHCSGLFVGQIKKYLNGYIWRPQCPLTGEWEVDAFLPSKTDGWEDAIGKIKRRLKAEARRREKEGRNNEKIQQKVD